MYRSSLLKTSRRFGIKFNNDDDFDKLNIYVVDNNFHSELTDDDVEIVKNNDGIVFGTMFNQRIDNLPCNLTLLVFGRWFNQPIDFLPQSLKYLVFDEDFNQCIDNLPHNLKQLVFYSGASKFNQKIDNLPNGLTHLTARLNLIKPDNGLRQHTHFAY